MDEASRADLERELRAAAGRGDWSACATIAIKGYGRELYGFLLAVHSNEEDASDSFGQLTEAIWVGLPSFKWESSFRTWAYAVARNLVMNARRDAGRRERRARRVGESALEGVAARLRTETLNYLRTQNRTSLQALRDGLPEEDRMLLVLRVDRGLSWKELAQIFYEGEATTTRDDAATASRESARLRKRFQGIKERLQARARAEGLLE